MDDFELYKLNISKKIYIEYYFLFNLLNYLLDRNTLNLVKKLFFYKYISKNTAELINDFNYRMKKYDVNLIYINEKDMRCKNEN